MLIAAGGGKPKTFPACKPDRYLFKPPYHSQLRGMGVFNMALQKKNLMTFAHGMRRIP